MMTNPLPRRCAAFALTDLLVVMMVVAVVLSLQLPADASARRTAQRMENSSRLRGIHLSSFTYANSNKNNLPGLNSRGRIVENSAESTGNCGDGDVVQARFWIMLDAHLFTPDYIISPSETLDATAYDPGNNANNPRPVLFKNNGKTHYSYAMLRILSAGGNPVNGGFSAAKSDAPRLQEWTATLNSQAVFMSDRNSGSNATNGAQSIHTTRPGDWKGSVSWNDGHVEYAKSQYFETRYANGALNRSNDRGLADNLFEDKNIGINAGENGGPDGSNALMVVDGNKGVFSNDAGDE